MKRILSFALILMLLLSLCACGGQKETAGEITVTDMIGRTVSVTPGSYKRVVCIGAGALRMYSYIGDVALLAGVEDIDNTTLSQRPAMFDSVARPYVLAFGDTFQKLPSCGVGGPMAQAAEAEKILACNPDIIISEFEDVEKSNALQQQLGVPVITLGAGTKGVFDEKFAGSMTLLGKIFGKENKAAALVKFVADEKAAIEARVANIPEEEKPSVYICGLGNWGTTNHLMTAENYIKVTVGGKTYELIGYDKDGAKVYQDAEVLKEQNAQLEAEKRAEIKPLAKEASDNENKINWLSKGESLTVDQYRDLRQYATEKSVVLQGFKNSDVAIDLAKEMIYEVNRMLSIYPELRGSAKKPFTLNLDRHMESVDFAEVREGASHIMHINIDAFRNQEILGQEYEKLAESGWFVKGTSYKSIIYHEIGHIVSDVYGIDGLSLMKKVLGTDSTAETLLWCKNNLSEYSFKSDGSEIISEMFSAYYGSEKPPKEVVDFMSICDRMIKDWREVK